MPNIDEIVSHVSLFLDNSVSVDEFGDWMLLYTGNLIWEGSTDNATRQLAYSIQSQMAIFDTGQITEERLRHELARAIEPFSSPNV
jgi:hypothetical protein